MRVKMRTEFVKLEREEEITATILSFMGEIGGAHFSEQSEIEKNMMIYCIINS